MIDIAPREDKAHDVVDEVLPEEFDWERLVIDYPVPALALAAVGGFLLGRHRGMTVLTALAGFGADRLSEMVNETIGSEVL